MHFCRFFPDRRLSTRCFTKGATHCSFFRALSKYYWKGLQFTLALYFYQFFVDRKLSTRYSTKGAAHRENLTDKFYQCMEKFALALRFRWLHADIKLCTRLSTKEAVHCSYRRALYNNYLKKIPQITFISFLLTLCWQWAMCK